MFCTKLKKCVDDIYMKNIACYSGDFVFDYIMRWILLKLKGDKNCLSSADPFCTYNT